MDVPRNDHLLLANHNTYHHPQQDTHDYTAVRGHCYLHVAIFPGALGHVESRKERRVCSRRSLRRCTGCICGECHLEWADWQS
jgi:hypothetical protein